MLKMRLDDPLDAVAVHMGGGTLGVIALPFFSQGTGIFWSQAGWTQLGANLLGLLVIYVWAGFWSIAIFGSLWYFKQLRIGRDVEFKGNDMVRINNLSDVGPKYLLYYYLETWLIVLFLKVRLFFSSKFIFHSSRRFSQPEPILKKKVSLLKVQLLGLWWNWLTTIKSKIKFEIMDENVWVVKGIIVENLDFSWFDFWLSDSITIQFTNT